MSRTNVRPLGAIAGPLLAGALVLGACGGDDDGTTASTIDLSGASTNFVVRPPVTTVAPDGAAGEISTGSQEYTVQAGDYPLKVANDFGITVEELVAFNEWGSANEFPFPGTVIRIPPGATTGGAADEGDAPASDADEDADAAEGDAGDTGDGGEESAEPVETIPDAGDNCDEGTYTIESGDFPLGVADKFDVTVDALNAANANTDGYSAFFPGLEIIIPAKADC